MNRMRNILILTLTLISTDYQLQISNQTPICSKSLTTCELAQKAIKKGWILSIPPYSQTQCIPFPNCFEKESNCIKNYNC